MEEMHILTTKDGSYIDVTLGTKKNVYSMLHILNYLNVRNAYR
jgi:hypothetical protein